jgi:hypothetical protein
MAAIVQIKVIWVVTLFSCRSIQIKNSPCPSFLFITSTDSDLSQFLSPSLSASSWPPSLLIHHLEHSNSEDGNRIFL